MNSQKGFGIIEVIIAMALFIIVATMGVTTVVGSFSVNRLGQEQTEATVYAQQGLEAARSIKNQGWTSPFLATSCASGCGVNVPGGGSWTWSGANNTNGDYTRTISVTNVQRNGSGDIVESGGTNDPDTKKVVSTVSWNFTPTRNNTVELSTYLTNFRKAIIGDWPNPSQESSIDISGNNNGVKVQTSGNYAYVVRDGGSPNFLIINVASPASPSIVGSLNLIGSPQNIYVSGNYAYVANSDNSRELQIVNISNPAAPSLVGTYNDSGNDDGRGVFVVGSYAYLAMNGGNDLTIVNVSNPAAPTFTGGVVLDGGAVDVVVQGSYAYLASSSNSQELQVVNVATPASPSLSSSLNASGNTDANALAIAGNTIFLAQGSTFITVNVTSPLSPSQLGSVSTSSITTDIALNMANSNTYVFLATQDNSLEFQVMNVAVLATPTLLGSVNLPSNDNLNGVAYSSLLDRAFVVGDSNSDEFIVIAP